MEPLNPGFGRIQAMSDPTMEMMAGRSETESALLSAAAAVAAAGVARSEAVRARETAALQGSSAGMSAKEEELSSEDTQILSGGADAALSLAIVPAAAVTAAVSDAAVADAAAEAPAVAAPAAAAASAAAAIVGRSAAIGDVTVSTDDGGNGGDSMAPDGKLEELTAQQVAALKKPELVLDSDLNRVRESISERKEGLEQNVLEIKTESKNHKTSFSLISHGLSALAVKDRTILDDESEFETGIAAEEDFITGNVSTLLELRTGTDSQAAGGGSRGGYGAAADNDDSDSSAESADIIIPPITQTMRSTLNLPNAGADRLRKERLFGLVMRDFGVNWLTYGLAVTACVLCLLKVYQVQETRDITAQLNELSVANADLDKEWLNLVAIRQNLSEHATIRACATSQLNMVSPKTQNEHVISFK